MQIAAGLYFRFLSMCKIEKQKQKNWIFFKAEKGLSSDLLMWLQLYDHDDN